ncbi:hypothetical protein TNCV_3017131 [Trichonephila clavipes]|nr:hypothetical protein TNCV_3017131 [Trichonephila clavipes]
MDSWLACHEFDPSTADEQPNRGNRCTLNTSRFKRSPVFMVGKVEKWYQFGCQPRHLTNVENYEVRRQKPTSS